MRLAILALFASVCFGQYQGPVSWPNLSAWAWLQSWGATLTETATGNNQQQIAADEAAVASAQSAVTSAQSAVSAAQAALTAAQATLANDQTTLTAAENKLAEDEAGGSLIAPAVLNYTNPGNQNEMMLVSPIPLPAPPYTVTLGLTINQTDFTREVSGTLMLRNSATDQAVLMTDENEMAVTGPGVGCCRIVAGGYLTKTLNVDADSYLTDSWWSERIPSQRVWERIQDDGHYRTYWSSNDDGWSWAQVNPNTELSGQYTVPNQAVIAAYTLDTVPFTFSFTIWQFSITTP